MLKLAINAGGGSPDSPDADDGSCLAAGAVAGVAAMVHAVGGDKLGTGGGAAAVLSTELAGIAGWAQSWQLTVAGVAATLALGFTGLGRRYNFWCFFTGAVGLAGNSIIRVVNASVCS